MTFFTRATGGALVATAAIAACSTAPSLPAVDTAGRGYVMPAADDGGGEDAGLGDGAAASDGTVAEDASDFGDAGVTCAPDLPLGGVSVPGNLVPATQPTLTGGTIGDGTYILTQHLYYETSAGPDAGSIQGGGSQQTIVIAGSVIKWTVKYDGDTTKTLVAFMTVGGVSPGDLTLHETCGPLGAGMTLLGTSYAVSGTTLQIEGTDFTFATGPAQKLPEMATFTRQ